MHSQQDTQCPLSVWEDALIAHVFPSPPLKFRTAGFPQYGFKREVDADLRGENKSTYTTPKSAATNPCGPEGQCNRVGLADTLVQRPLAHRRLCCPAGSMLTMASSEPLVTAETPYFLRPSGNHGSE